MTAKPITPGILSGNTGKIPASGFTGIRKIRERGQLEIKPSDLPEVNIFLFAMQMI